MDVCSRFKRGNTRGGPFEDQHRIKDVILAQRYATYYDQLRWITIMKGGEMSIELDKPDKPIGEDIRLERIPVSTGEILYKYFPDEYLKNCEKCTKLLNGFGFVPLDKSKYDEFRIKQNKLFAKKALDCSIAAKALNEWNIRIEQLKGEMKAYCANQSAAKQTTSQANSSTSGNSQLKLSTSSSSSNTNSGASANTANANSSGGTPAEKPISYSKSKSSVQSSRLQGSATAAGSGSAYENQVRQQIRNQQQTWNSFNKSERRISQAFENLFWKDFEKEQAKEERREREEMRRATRAIERRFNNYISDWEAYQNNLAKWMVEYAKYIPTDALRSVESGIRKAKGNISAALVARRGYNAYTDPGDNSTIEGGVSESD